MIEKCKNNLETNGLEKICEANIQERWQNKRIFRYYKNREFIITEGTSEKYFLKRRKIIQKRVSVIKKK